MDVNGSRFHLLQGARDWLPLLAGSASGLAELPGDPPEGRIVQCLT